MTNDLVVLVKDAVIDELLLTETTEVASVVVVLGVRVSVRVVDVLLDLHAERIGVAHRDCLDDVSSPLRAACGNIRAVDSAVGDVVREERTCIGELLACCSMRTQLPCCAVIRGQR